MEHLSIDVKTFNSTNWLTVAKAQFLTNDFNPKGVGALLTIGGPLSGAKKKVQQLYMASKTSCCKNVQDTKR